jgi:hypothetical protein
MSPRSLLRLQQVTRPLSVLVAQARASFVNGLFKDNRGVGFGQATFNVGLIKFVLRLQLTC